MTSTSSESPVRAGGLDVYTPGLIQVWYSDYTLNALKAAIIEAAPAKVAWLSCPSLYFHDEAARWRDTFGLVNFEFDRRWESDPGFVFYDCYRPTEIAEQLHGQFDFIVADPPAINNRTLECYAATIKLLAARGAKIIFSTLENFDPTMQDLLGLSPQRFRPDLPGFALDGRWCFYTSFACRSLSQPNPVADAKREAAKLEEEDQEGYAELAAGFHQPQHEI